MPHSFQTTQWSLEKRAGSDVSLRQRVALSQLICRYTPALRFHLVGTRRIDPGRADDLIQSFILNKFLQGNLIAKASPERGRFRGFLCTSLNRFVANELRSERAQMRSLGKSITVDGDLYVADPSPPADTLFDVAWARQLLADALTRMESECERSGRSDIWGVFQARILAGILRDAEPVPYEQIVKTFGFSSPAQASNILVTGRRMFTRELRRLIGEYETDETGIDDELKELQAILCGSAAIYSAASAL